MSPLNALLLAAGVCAATESVDLGGLRKAQATIALDGDQFEIKVAFLPVRCFDQTTNQQMNLGVGRSLALQALAQHLAGERSVELTVSGARTTGASASAKTFSLTLRVPRDGVRIRDVEAIASASAPADPHDVPAGTVRLRPSKLTRRAQYEQTIAQLEAILRDEFKQRLSQPAATGLKGFESFRARIDIAFEGLASEIKNDLELTNLGSSLDSEKGEKDQLLETLASERQQLIEHLKAESIRHSEGK